MGNLLKRLGEGTNEQVQAAEESWDRFTASSSFNDDQYRVVEQIGEGATATVYKCIDTANDDQIVIVKQFHADTDSSTLHAASSEFSRLVMADGCDAVPLALDHFQENDKYYLVMSYIQGDSLDGKRLRREDILQLLEDILTVLDFLGHLPQPIVHRDIKPANIIKQTQAPARIADEKKDNILSVRSSMSFLLSDEDLVPSKYCLIDFGAAFAMNQSVNKSDLKEIDSKSSNSSSSSFSQAFELGRATQQELCGKATGTPLTMAPEMCGKVAKVSRRSDVFSLAATAIWLLLGEDELREARPAGDFPSGWSALIKDSEVLESNSDLKALAPLLQKMLDADANNRLDAGLALAWVIATRNGRDELASHMMELFEQRSSAPPSPSSSSMAAPVFISLEKFIWQCKDDSQSGAWWNYPTKITEQLEKAYQTGSEQHMVSNSGYFGAHRYSFDFERMVQIDTKTKSEFSIRRISAADHAKEADRKYRELLVDVKARDAQLKDKEEQMTRMLTELDGSVEKKFWITSGLGESLNPDVDLHSHRDEKTHSNMMFLVKNGSSEWNSIVAKFKQQYSGAQNTKKVVKIRRIEDHSKFRIWNAWKNRIRNEIGDQKWSNTRHVLDLWHGSTAENLKKIIDVGFLPMLSGTSTGHIYGMGSYFARDSKMSDSYAKGTNYKQMLLCKVITGLSVKGTKGQKKTPVIPGRGNLCYHSFSSTPVKNGPIAPIYVIQHSQQAYASYLVTYR